MESFLSLGELLLNMQWTDILDIIIVAFLIYKLLPILRSSGTARVGGVIVIVLIVAWLTDLLKLHTLNFILSQLLTVGLIAVVVLFQPELRRMLDHVSKMKFKNWLGTTRSEQEMVPVIQETVRACEIMSHERVGALIVFARDVRLDEYFKTGTILDAQASEQLIRNVFFPKASLHDGAMIVRDGRVAAAGCVLPLSETQRLNADLGTRHRAAVGMSEVSDAVVVIVSEETGVISVAVNGMLKRHLAPQTLERLLRNELCPETEDREENPVIRLGQKLKEKEQAQRTQHQQRKESRAKAKQERLALKQEKREAKLKAKEASRDEA